MEPKIEFKKVPHESDYGDRGLTAYYVLVDGVTVGRVEGVYRSAGPSRHGRSRHIFAARFEWTWQTAKGYRLHHRLSRETRKEAVKELLAAVQEGS